MVFVNCVTDVFLADNNAHTTATIKYEKGEADFDTPSLCKDVRHEDMLSEGTVHAWVLLNAAFAGQVAAAQVYYELQVGRNEASTDSSPSVRVVWADGGHALVHLSEVFRCKEEV